MIRYRFSNGQVQVDDRVGHPLPARRQAGGQGILVAVVWEPPLPNVAALDKKETPASPPEGTTSGNTQSSAER